MATVTVTKPKTVYLVNQDEGHNKFYIIAQNTTTVITTNGRLGNKGVSKQHNFKHEWEATEFARDKHAEKHRKNYMPISEEKFRELQVESAIIGSANKCEKLEWVLLDEDTRESQCPKATDEQLIDPNNRIGLLIAVSTRKAYIGNCTYYQLLLTEDGIFSGWGGCWIRLDEVKDGKELAKFANKVAEAAATRFVQD